MRGNTLRLIEQGCPLCAEIFSWNSYPGVKRNHRCDTQLRVWRRSWKTKIRNCQRSKDYSESCLGFQMVLWTTIEIWWSNSCISLWEEIRFINWASQTKSHLSVQQGRKMVKRWREVTDSIHRNISRSFQALSDWTWNGWLKWIPTSSPSARTLVAVLQICNVISAQSGVMKLAVNIVLRVSPLSTKADCSSHHSMASWPVLRRYSIVIVAVTTLVWDVFLVTMMIKSLKQLPLLVVSTLTIEVHGAKVGRCINA